MGQCGPCWIRLCHASPAPMTHVQLAVPNSVAHSRRTPPRLRQPRDQVPPSGVCPRPRDVAVGGSGHGGQVRWCLMVASAKAILQQARRNGTAIFAACAFR